MPRTEKENHEADTAADGRYFRFLHGSTVEIIRDARPVEPPSHALFDFDGTVSLIREGWQDIMVPLMVELLAETGTGETVEELTAVVSEYVERLTGEQTIYQMIRLAEEIRKRGGTPREPLYYKRLYHERLIGSIHDRREGLRSGRIEPEAMIVPGADKALALLRDRGVVLYLASGTDEPYVIEEARLLGLDTCFGEHIYGARDDYRTFSKEHVIRRILELNGVGGASLIGFGDGYVEIANVKGAGGMAVGVASDEKGRSGRPDEWKRARLIGAGADVIIPDFCDCEVLFDYIWIER